MPVVPKFVRFEDTGGSNDAGNQLGRGHVKTRVPRAAARIGDSYIAAYSLRISPPCAEDFRLVALLDGNVGAAL